MCEKTLYFSFKDAEKAMGRVIENSDMGPRPTGTRLNIYTCPVCRKKYGKNVWHIGNTKKRRGLKR